MKSFWIPNRKTDRILVKTIKFYKKTTVFQKKINIKTDRCKFKNTSVNYFFNNILTRFFVNIKSITQVI